MFPRGRDGSRRHLFLRYPFQEKIRPFASVLDKFLRLQPVSYDWRADEYPEYRFGDTRTSGLIAQEVEKVFPEMVSIDAKGYKQVDYSQLPLLMLEAIRELKEENDALREQLNVQQGAFERRLEMLEEASEARINRASMK